jgi:predicted Holliday junction resolvase-like endonuclease
VVVLWVWIAVVVLALVVLGVIGYGLVGALTRLRREVEGAQRDLEPVLRQLQASAAHAESVAARRANTG